MFLHKLHRVFYKLCEVNDPAGFSVLPEVRRNLRCSISPLKFDLICVGDKSKSRELNSCHAGKRSYNSRPG